MTSDRKGREKKRERWGVMRIKRTSGNRERVSTSGQGIVPRRRPTIPHHRPPLPSHCLPLILSCSLLIYPLRRSISFTSALSRFVTPPPFLSLSLSLPLYSHPPRSAVMAATFSRPLIYYRSPSREEGPFKKDSVLLAPAHTLYMGALYCT